MTAGPNKLSGLEKLGYAFGDSASNFVFHVINLFLLYYYTDVFGLDPKAVGTLFLVARIWDAISDPVMGALADRTNTKMGRYRPYLLWLAIPYGIIGFLAFAGPDFGDSNKLIYAYITYFAIMTMYTAINVPYSALMGVMTPDPSERTTLSSWRFIGAFSAQLLIGLIFLPMVRVFGDGNEVLGFRVAMGILSVVSVAMFLFTFFATREKIEPQKNVEPDFKRDLLALASNGPWLVMVIAAVLTLANVALRGAVTIHFFKYVANIDDQPVWWFLDKTSFFFTTGSLAFICGVFLTGFLAKKLGKRNALILVTILNGITLLGFYFIPADQYTLMILVNVIGAFIAGPAPALVWSIYTDVADYGEWKTGYRNTGMTFSGAMFAQKIGLAIGGSLAGWLLAWFGFKANAEQSDQAVNGIKLLFSIIPGCLAVANGLVLLFYGLSDQKMQEIAKDLEQRRAE